MMARFQWLLDSLAPHQLKNVRVGPPLTKLSGSAHVSRTHASIHGQMNMSKLIQIMPLIFVEVGEGGIKHKCIMNAINT